MWELVTCYNLVVGDLVIILFSMLKSSKLKIEKVIKKDVADIVKIHKECILKTNSKYYSIEAIKEWSDQVNEQNVLAQLDNTKWLVLRKNKNIIGFCQYDLVDSELNQIQIQPEYQHHGYGKYLYEYIEKDFVRNGNKKLSLFATLNAVQFYESLGFTKIKLIKYHIDSEDIEMFEMAKVLENSQLN
jgi:ribosomal protein S18 acetylase RimI-like enzyme